MMLRAQVKRNARRALSGNWGRAICIILIVMAILLFFNCIEAIGYAAVGCEGMINQLNQFHMLMSEKIDFRPVLITTVTALICMVVSAPLMLGETDWYRRLVINEPEEISSVFSLFSPVRTFLRSLWFTISLGLRMLFWAAVFFLLPAAVLGLGSYSLRVAPDTIDNIFTSLSILIGTVLTILMGILYLIFIQRYFAAAYLFLGDQKVKIRRAIRESVHCTKGCLGDLFVFQFTFLGWFLLCVFILPLLYVKPYYCASHALYANILIERHRRMGGATPEGYEAESEPKEEIFSEGGFERAGGFSGQAHADDRQEWDTPQASPEETDGENYWSHQQKGNIKGDDPE